MANITEGFFSGLFDFTFTKFVTTRIAPVIYILGMVIFGIVSIAFALSGFSRGLIAGVITIVVSPVVFFLLLIYLRVILEVVIVAFKTCENTRRTADNTRQL